MKTRTSIIFFSAFSFLLGTKAEAQATDPTLVVSKYAKYMSEWSKTGDGDYSYVMQDSVFPKKGKNNGYDVCIVNNSLMKIFAEKDKTGKTSTAVTNQAESYLQELTKAFDQGMKFKHDEPVWNKDFVEPTYGNVDKVPIRFATMPYSTTGSVEFYGSDLYFVQGDYIVKILDHNDPLAKAIRLYSDKKYNEAFRIFREVAYAAPNNYDAQYWTAVMEIKKQGCSHLGSKVRDLEAAWWISHGKLDYDDGFSLRKMSLNYFQRDMSLTRLRDLYDLLLVDMEYLPYHNTSKSFFLYMLNNAKLVSEGLMPFRKSNKDTHMGYMDESGKVVIPCKYDFAFPFNSNGLALILFNHKYGYVNRVGELVIPTKYKKALMWFFEDRTYVLQDDSLLLIDVKGNIIKNVGNGFDKLGISKPIVHNNKTDKWYSCDFDGNIKEVKSDGGGWFFQPSGFVDLYDY